VNRIKAIDAIAHITLGTEASRIRLFAVLTNQLREICKILLASTRKILIKTERSLRQLDWKGATCSSYSSELPNPQDKRLGRPLVSLQLPVLSLN